MTSQPFNNETSQAERRDVVENDRKVRDSMPKTTFATFAEAFADEERGGRFKTDRPTLVIGSTPIPNYPGAGQEDLAGQEPPLGYVDAAPIVGEPHEVRASIDRLQKKSEDPEAT
jgi:hypothetical protein